MNVPLVLTVICLFLSPFLQAMELPQAAELGQALAAEARSRAPAQDIQSQGALVIRRDGKIQARIPVRFSIRLTDKGWNSIYEAQMTATCEQVLIRHLPEGPNEYRIERGQTNAVSNTSTRIPNDQAGIAFAGSDFFLTDLGLEFFNWPTQRLIKKEMRKSRACNVLESINPAAQSGSYARVISWLDIETGGLLLAEAYDSNQKLLKEFSIRGFSKIQGQWHLKEMEIRNAQTGSKTWLEFDLKIKEPPPQPR